MRDIYRQFIEDGKPESRIAADLNARGINTDLGRDWTRGVVHQILTNEKYFKLPDENDKKPKVYELQRRVIEHVLEKEDNNSAARNPAKR